MGCLNLLACGFERFIRAMEAVGSTSRKRFVMPEFTEGDLQAISQHWGSEISQEELQVHQCRCFYSSICIPKSSKYHLVSKLAIACLLFSSQDLHRFQNPIHLLNLSLVQFCGRCVQSMAGKMEMGEFKKWCVVAGFLQSLQISLVSADKTLQEQVAFRGFQLYNVI